MTDSLQPLPTWKSSRPRRIRVVRCANTERSCSDSTWPTRTVVSTSIPSQPGWPAHQQHRTPVPSGAGWNVDTIRRHPISACCLLLTPRDQPTRVRPPRGTRGASWRQRNVSSFARQEAKKGTKFSGLQKMFLPQDWRIDPEQQESAKPLGKKGLRLVLGPQRGVDLIRVMRKLPTFDDKWQPPRVLRPLLQSPARRHRRRCCACYTSRVVRASNSLGSRGWRRITKA